MRHWFAIGDAPLVVPHISRSIVQTQREHIVVAVCNFENPLHRCISHTGPVALAEEVLPAEKRVQFDYSGASPGQPADYKCYKVTKALKSPKIDENDVSQLLCAALAGCEQFI